MHEMPAKVPRKNSWYEKMSHDPEIHAAVKSFLGFNRDVPSEIIDDELIDMIWETRMKFNWTGEQVGKYVKSVATREERAQARAVLMNLSKMKREGGYPWEQ